MALVQHAGLPEIRSFVHGAGTAEGMLCDCGTGKDGSSEGQQLPEWSSLGGLQPVIRQLKEMVILPLLYPTLYRQMGITAPRSTGSRPATPSYEKLHR